MRVSMKSFMLESLKFSKIGNIVAAHLASSSRICSYHTSSVCFLYINCAEAINKSMTLQDLEWQGLLVLPKKDNWKVKDSAVAVNSSDLTLQRIQMWGYEKGNDDGIGLYCLDRYGNTYVAEISRFSECLSRAFMTTFFVESYGQKITDIFSKEMKLDARDAEYMSIFATEFTRPGLVDMRCAYYAKQEAEAETKAKRKLRFPSFMVRKASKAH